MPGHRFARSAVGLACSLALALSACTGKGGSSAASPKPSGLTAKAYVAGACLALVTWKDAILSDTTAMETKASSASSLVKEKKVLGDYLDTVIQETDTLTSHLKSLGPPAVSGGASANAALLQLMERVRSVFAEARVKVDGLPTNSRSAFVKATTQLGQDIQTSMSGADVAMNSFNNPALNQAAAADPVCKSLQSG